MVLLCMAMASGCRDPDNGQSPAGDAQPSESLLPAAELPLPVNLPSDGWLILKRLDQYAGPLTQEAAKSGFAADLVQPDPGVGQYFLMASASSAAIRQLNGFFYWYLDQNPSDADQPLLLVLDRLFSDATREAALAGGLFTDPAVVSLLTFSLQQLLQDLYQPDILNFILECYRREFSNRQQDLNPSGQIWKQSFNRIEVTYEAAFYNAVSFYVLPA